MKENYVVFHRVNSSSIKTKRNIIVGVVTYLCKRGLKTTYIVAMEHPIKDYPATFEDEEFICYLKDGIIFGRFKKHDCVVDLELMKKGIGERIKISGGIDRPVLIDVRRLKYWTREAKEYGMSKEGTLYIKASAILINSVVLRISINWALKTFKHDKPSLFFTDEVKAVRWLEQFR
jgi:hypothetical protein